MLPQVKPSLIDELSLFYVESVDVTNTDLRGLNSCVIFQTELLDELAEHI